MTSINFIPSKYTRYTVYKSSHIASCIGTSVVASPSICVHNMSHDKQAVSCDKNRAVSCDLTWSEGFTRNRLATKVTYHKRLSCRLEGGVKIFPLPIKQCSVGGPKGGGGVITCISKCWRKKHMAYGPCLCKSC